MTEEQFSRWREFSINLAIHGFPVTTEKRRDRLVTEIVDYFEWRDLKSDFLEIVDWDGNGDNYYLCDRVNEFFEDHYHWIRKNDAHGGRFYDQITSCIKAGFDIAVTQSGGGVVGFSVGDIRRMWDGNIPEWVKLTLNLKDNFDIMSDNYPLWL